MYARKSLEMTSPTSPHSSHKMPRKTDRSRPLRTYSKRAIPNDSAEPPLKRRRTDEAARDPGKHRPIETPSHDSPQNKCSEPLLPPSHVPHHHHPKRGTILSYFKVVSPSSNSNNMSSSSMEPSSCSGGTERTPTPPSSPPPRATNIKPKKRRRLTTKIVPPRELDTAEDEETCGQGRPPTKEEPLSGALIPTSTNTLNKVAAAAAQSQPERQQQSESRKRRKKTSIKGVSTVQTTLSLSMSDQGFAECSECGMLYNPYHEKDAKFHARRHAAILKTRANEKTKSKKGGGAS